MLPSSALWVLYAVTLLVSLCAVRVTNVRRSHRLLRILARHVLLVVIVLGSYQGFLWMCSFSSQAVVVARAASSAPTPLVGDSVVGGPSISASSINQVLTAAGSPAAGTGQSLYDLSVQYHIDDAYALATFQHESDYGKYGAAAVDHSLGNINCTEYPTCDGRFRFYASWSQGYEDFYRLIVQVYVAQGRTTIATIIPMYAPSSDNNDVALYIASLRRLIHVYRTGQGA